MITMCSLRWTNQLAVHNFLWSSHTTRCKCNIEIQQKENIKHKEIIACGFCSGLPQYS